MTIYIIAAGIILIVAFALWAATWGPQGHTITKYAYNYYIL